MACRFKLRARACGFWAKGALALVLLCGLPATHDAYRHAGASAHSLAFASGQTLFLRRNGVQPSCLNRFHSLERLPGAIRSCGACLQASAVRTDDFQRRQGSGTGNLGPFSHGSAGAPGSSAMPVVRDLPSGSLREQREMLNQIHVEREAWYDLMKRRVRASSYQDGTQDIRRLFSQFDTNKNGALDWSEYRTLLMRMGMRPFGITDEDLRILFYEMGATGRGLEVRAREFFSWMSGSRQDVGLAMEGGAGMAQAPAAAPQSGWTSGQSIWWDEGPETRVLQTIGQASISRASAAFARAETVQPETNTRAVQQVAAANEAAGSEVSGRAAAAVRDSAAQMSWPPPVSLEVGGPSGSTLLQALVDDVRPWTDATPEGLHDAVYFLVNEIGLPENKVKALALEMPDIFSRNVDMELRPRIDDLRTLGVPVNKIARLLSSVPDLLDLKGWEKRQGAVGFLSELGIERERVGLCLVRHPRVLDLSVETMSAVVEFLVGVGRIPRSKVSKVVEAMPSVLSHSVDLNLRPKLAFLTEDVGISHERMAAVLIKFPQVLGLSVEGNLRPTVRYLMHDLGVRQQDLSRMLSSMPQLLGLSVEGNLKVKVQYLVSELGVPEEQLCDVIAKCPSLLSLSVEKNLQPKVRFLVDEAGFSREEIVRAPNVLAYSMDRMRSRYDFLCGKGLKLGLASMLSYSNSQFQKRFDHDGDLL
jgi:hypothetical protein